ncbi:hypothetical protein BGZ61DRAFT_460257 [Ilyonectria robusta]|uniref:uncharacterized protein n=1 Tax=Ilyonectria robusta TaxID=1079257 RepID=UPI001E8DA85A|nr:uncharacterized protein BGZ61DRAFT_460257 [Ilyonectria robusta]KAH8669940.1 hypothetical protein BGZ61DRAFT_460257 [Ilyonectria robusta]
MNQQAVLDGSNPVDLFTSLPLELKREICEYLCDHCKTTIPQHEAFKPRYAPLASLCLASRALRDAAEPVLYHLFFYQYGQRQERLEPFSKTLLQGPDLAAHIRRIRYEPEPWDDYNDESEALEGSLETTSAIENLRLHRSLFDLVLSRAENLEELSIQIEGGWRMPLVDLPRLRDLHLQQPELWTPPSLTYPKGERGLNTAPLLERLWLDKWSLFDVAHHDLLDLVSHVHKLSIQPDSEGYGSLEDNIKIIVKALPKLTSFDFFDEHLGVTPQFELLSRLLVRKDSLTDIYIETDVLYIDLDLISRFANLKHLRLDCDMVFTLGAENEYKILSSTLGVHRLPLPYSLETLWICPTQESSVWILVWLSLSLSQYVNLEYVRCISGRWDGDRAFQDEMTQMLKEECVEENFRKANVRFDEVNCVGSCRSLVESVL